MTYGEAAAELREAITLLMRHRRMGLALGGSTSGAPANASRETVLEAVGQILRYRAVLWNYTITALDTVAPVGMPRTNGPFGRVRVRLEANRPDRSTQRDGRCVTMDDLCTPSPFLLVDLWRRAAVAAVTSAERELPLVRRTLTTQQGALLVTDACEVIRAVIRLDDLYSMRDWSASRGRRSQARARSRRTADYRLDPQGLCNSVLRCEEWAAAGLTEQSYTLDQLGYRPPLKRVDRLPDGGIDDAFRALHNVRVALRDGLPTMSATTTLLRHSRLESALAYRLACADGEPAMAGIFERRARTYAGLLLATVNVGGTPGQGTTAVAASREALDAVEHVKAATRPQLAHLAGALHAIDADVSSALRRGIKERAYCVTNRRELVGGSRRGVLRTEDWYEPITKSSHPELLNCVAKLRPKAARPMPTESGVVRRSALRDLIGPGGGRAEHEHRVLERLPQIASSDLTNNGSDRLSRGSHTVGHRFDAL